MPDDGVMDPYGLQDRLTAGTMRHLSPSTINDSDICLRRLTYKWDPTVPRGDSEARVVGTCYHAGLEDYYRARIGHSLEILEPLGYALEGAQRCMADQTFDAWETSKAEALAKVESMLTSYFEGGHQWGLDYRVMAVEQKWIAPLNEKWAVRGAIDLVIQNPRGETVIVDQKTAGRKWQAGKESPRKNQQAVLYCWAWWRCTGEIPLGMTFDVMTYNGAFERRWSYPSPEAMTATLNKAMQLGHIIDVIPLDQMPTNTSSVLCSSRFCDYFDICPAGAAIA